MSCMINCRRYGTPNVLVANTQRRDMLVLEMGFSSIFRVCDCRTTTMILCNHGKNYEIDIISQQSIFSNSLFTIRYMFITSAIQRLREGNVFRHVPNSFPRHYGIGICLFLHKGVIEYFSKSFFLGTKFRAKQSGNATTPTLPSSRQHGG